MPDIQGIIAGHLYYFLTVLYPLSSGKKILKTPRWMYPFLFITIYIFKVHNINAIILNSQLSFNLNYCYDLYKMEQKKGNPNARL